MARPMHAVSTPNTAFIFTYREAKSNGKGKSNSTVAT